jgi:hypothetical protein
VTEAPDLHRAFAPVHRAAAPLPGVEEGLSYGTPALRVAGKLFARLREDGDTLVLATDFDSREAMLKAEPGLFFITDHYRDYPWVLVRLSTLRPARLGELLGDAWERVAPKRLRAERAGTVARGTRQAKRPRKGSPAGGAADQESNAVPRRGPAAGRRKRPGPNDRRPR